MLVCKAGNGEAPTTGMQILMMWCKLNFITLQILFGKLSGRNLGFVVNILFIIVPDLLKKT